MSRFTRQSSSRRAVFTKSAFRSLLGLGVTAGAWNLAVATAAADTSWTLGGTGTTGGGTGNWNVAGNWSNNTPDTGTQNAFVNNGGTVQITGSQSAFDINAGTVTNGSGTYTMTAGTLSGNSWFRYGGASGATGTFNLNAGTVNSSTTQGNSNINIGEVSGGTGFIYVAGGTFNANNTALIQIGRDFGSTGTLTLSSGAFNMAAGAALRIGLGGTGTLAISGGAFTNNNPSGSFVSIGTNQNGSNTTGATGTLTISGGSYVATNSTPMNVSDNAYTKGTVNMSGTGLLNLKAGILAVGKTTNATGIVNLGDGNVYNGSTVTPTIQTGSVVGGNGSGTFNFNGGRLLSNAASTTFFGSTAVTNAYVRNGGAFIDSGGGSITITQALKHTVTGGDAATDGGLTKLGANTLTLTGTSTYNGGTFDNAGVLQFGSTTAIPTTGLITINGGGALNAAGAYTTVSTWLTSGKLAPGSAGVISLTGNSAENINFTGFANLGLGASAAATYTGTITPTGTTYHVGGGGAALTLPNANQLTGANGVNYGATASGTGATASPAASGSVILLNSQDYTGASTVNGVTLQLGNGTTGNDGALTGTSAVTDNTLLTYNLFGSQTAPYNITGTGALTKSGAGTLTLSGTNSLAGAVSVNAGTLAITGGALSGSTVSPSIVVNNTGTGTGTLTQSGGAVSAGTGEVWIGEGTGSTGVYNLSGGSLTINNWFAVGRTNSTGTLNISGGTLTKNGTSGNSVTLVGNATVNQSAGDFNITAGPLWIGEVLAGTYNMSGGTVTAQNVEIGRGSTASGTLTLQGSTGLTGALANGGGNEVFTATTLTLNLAGTGAAAVNLSGGTLAISGLVAGGGTGTKTINLDGGLLRTRVADNAAFLGGTGITANVLAGGARLDTNGFNVGINTPLLHGGAGTDGGLTKSGIGALTLTATNTYNGATTISAGTLQIGAGGTAGSILSTSNVVDNAALIYNRSDANTLANAISGSGTFTKLGTGALTLSGANSYVGGTTVSAGSLVSGNVSALPANTALANTTTVNFNGQYLQPAGSVTPGLTLSTLNAGAASRFVFTLNATGADYIAFSGAATVASGAGLTVSAPSGVTLTPGSYNLFTAASGLDNFALTNNSVVTNGYYYALTLNATPTADILTVGNAQIAKLYYTGNISNSLSVAGNYSTDAAGATASTASPSSITDLYFTATTANVANYGTTLGGVTAANSLEFSGTAGNPAATTPVSISGPGTLTLTAGVGTFAAGVGIVVDSGAAAVTISADLALGASQSYANNSANLFTVSGGVNGGGFALTLLGTGPTTLSGALSNLSSVTNSATGLVTLGGANTFTGPLNLNAGNLSFSASNNLGTGNIVSFNGGILVFAPGNTADITADHTVRLAGASGFNTNGNDVTLAGPIAVTAVGSINKFGAGTLTLSGGLTYTAANVGNVFVRGGAITFSGATEIVNTAGIYSSIGQNAGDRGTLNILNGATFTTTSDFNLGDVGGTTLANVNGGIVNLNGTGSALTDAGFFVGKSTSTTAQYGYGVFNQSGGAHTSTSNSQIGAYGIGQYNLTGGTWTRSAGGFLSVGRQLGSFGVLDVSGSGIFTDNSGGARSIISELGTAVLNVRAGGVFNANTSTTATSTVGLSSALAALTIGNGTGTVAPVGIVNLLTGGTINTQSVGSYTGTVAAGQVAPISQFNFNGGTLKNTVVNATLMQNLTTANVFVGGANIDTTAGTATISQALLAPAGNGVNSITATGTGFSTTPIVQITGGGGVGATAVATVDNTGTLTGITITNPGINYTSAPTVTITGPFGTQVIGTATIAANDTTGGLTKLAANTLVLSGNNTYGGTTTISAGTLQLGAGGTAGTLGAGSVADNGALTFYRSDNLAVANVISGSGTLNQGILNQNATSGSLLTLSGNNSFTGDVTVNVGGLIATNSNAFGTGTKNIFLNNGTAGNSRIGLDGTAGNVDLPATFTYFTSNQNGAIFNLAGTNSIAGQITLTAGGGPTLIQSNAGTLTVSANIGANTDGRGVILQGNSTEANNVTGIISNGVTNTTALPVTKAGTGTWILSGPNTYTGVTTVSGGTLSVADIENGGVASNIGASTAAPANLVLSGSGTLLYTGPAVTTDRGFTIGAGTAGATGLGGPSITNANNLTFSGQILASGNGSFSKNGAGTLAFTNVTGTNTLAGGNVGNGLGFVVNKGLVQLGGTPGAPLNQTNAVTGEVSVGTLNIAGSPNATLEINGGSTMISSYLSIGRGNGVNNAATTVIENNNAVVTAANFAMGYDNGVSGYTSSPTFTLNDTSSFSDTGVFTVGESANGAGGLSTVNVNGNATLTTSNASNAVSVGLSGAGTVNQSGGTATFASPVTVGRNASSTGIYNLTGGTLNARNILKGAGSGSLNLNGGTLTPTAGDNPGTGTGTYSFVTGVSANVGNGGAVINTNGFNVTFSSGLVPAGGTGTGGLTKSGAGRLNLTASNSYTGATFVNAGTLNVDNGSTVPLTTAGSLSATTAITVNTGGTLLLSGSNMMNNRLNDAASVNLAGGTVSLAGVAEGGGNASALAPTGLVGVGALTLQGGLTSIIDLQGTSLLHFADSSVQDWSGTLAIYNYTGAGLYGGAAEQLLFGLNDNSLTTTQLGQISFYSDSGTTFLGYGGFTTTLGDGEIVPVPEPATWLAGALSVGLLGYAQRRRVASWLGLCRAA